MNTTTVSTVRALVRLACSARRQRAEHPPMTPSWYASNAEFYAYRTAARISAQFAKMDEAPPHQWNPWPNPRFDDIRIFQRCLTIHQNL